MSMHNITQPHFHSAALPPVEMALGKLRLRRFRPDDRNALAELANNYKVSRYLAAGFPFPYTLDDADAWLQKVGAEDTALNFAIEFEGSLAGGTGFEDFDQSGGMAVFGYWLGEKFWGRGLATQAAGLMLDYAFGPLGLKAVEARVDSRNYASIKVLAKNGFAIKKSITASATPGIYMMVRLNRPN